MSSKKPKATRKRMISCFAQIVQEHIPATYGTKDLAVTYRL